ncbi:MAG: 5-(carboxyamino)imidazole ribonucleotide mutase [Leifsonia xyli]|nr:MAG: 5-(carboxyamino)imidazole ribonucleotide mutase [Leifsonia xyli]
MTDTDAPVQPLVSIIMGSDSDWPTMRAAADILAELGIPFEADVVSAHRTPDKMTRFARGTAERGIRVVIAGAGGAAHLPGMVASMTTLPVIGVPVQLARLDGLDSLLSIVQMPAGIPVATMAINGAANAGLLAARIIGSSEPAVAARLTEYADGLEKLVEEKAARLRDSL